MAKKLLADPDLQEIPATQIALAVGFNSYTAFAENFKNKEEVDSGDLDCKKGAEYCGFVECDPGCDLKGELCGIDCGPGVD